jgi:hypothetical protein
LASVVATVLAADAKTPICGFKEYDTPPEISRRSRAIPFRSSGDQARLNPTDTPVRVVSVAPSPPPVNQTPREK